VIILSEEHLKQMLKEIMEEYHHFTWPHQGLDGDPPFPAAKPEPVIGVSHLVWSPVVRGLHQSYVQLAPCLLPFGILTKIKTP
jgi:hypothetical protein